MVVVMVMVMVMVMVLAIMAMAAIIHDGDVLHPDAPACRLWRKECAIGALEATR
jgi:hypothetical protein